MAVVGFGFMGVTHAKNILASASLELCGVVDNRGGDLFAGLADSGNQGALDLPLERLRRAPVFKTLEECVDKAKPDAVALCVPLFLHHALAKRALELGLDVLLEKPFCPEPEQCQELVELADGLGRVLMVAHCVRFSPAWEFLDACVKDGRHGALRLLATSRLAGEPTWGVWKDEAVKKTCGGALMDLLVHDLDFVDGALGSPEDVKLGLNVGDYWEVALGFGGAGGPRVSVKGGFLWRNSPFSSDYAATFEGASVRFCSQRPDVVQIGSDKGLETVGLSGDGYVNELDYFARCVESRGRPERCPPSASARAVELCRRVRALAG